MEELQKQNEILVGRLEKAKEVFKDQKKQIDDKNTKIAEQQAMIDKLNEQLKNASANEELQNKIKEYEAKVTDLESKWNDKVIENDDLALELNKAKTEAITNKKYAQEYEQKYESKCVEYEKQTADVKELTQQVHESAAALQDFKKAAEEEIANTKKAYEEKLKTEIGKANTMLAEEQKKTNDLTNKCKEFETKLAQSEQNCKKALDENVALNKKLQDTTNKLNNAKTNTANVQNEVKEVIKRVQTLDNNLTANFNIFQ